MCNKEYVVSYIYKKRLRDAGWQFINFMDFLNTTGLNIKVYLNLKIYVRKFIKYKCLQFKILYIFKIT